MYACMYVCMYVCIRTCLSVSLFVRLGYACVFQLFAATHKLCWTRNSGAIECANVGTPVLYREGRFSETRTILPLRGSTCSPFEDRGSETSYQVRFLEPGSSDEEYMDPARSAV